MLKLESHVTKNKAITYSSNFTDAQDSLQYRETEYFDFHAESSEKVQSYICIRPARDSWNKTRHTIIKKVLFQRASGLYWLLTKIEPIEKVI